jgi:hypothetical protein
VTLTTVDILDFWLFSVEPDTKICFSGQFSVKNTLRNLARRFEMVTVWGFLNNLDS